MARVVRRLLTSELWNDEKFEARGTLERAPFEERSFFVYLFSNERSQGMSGIYRVRVGQLVADLEALLSERQIRAYLDSLQQRRLIVYDEPWLWIVSLFKRSPRSPSVLIGVADDLERCGSLRIFEAWHQKYPHAQVRATKFRGQVEEIEGVLDQAGQVQPAPDLEPEDPRAKLYEDKVQAVWQHYLGTMSTEGRTPTYTLTTKRRKKIIDRLGDKIVDPETGQIRAVLVEDLMLAIERCAKSPFHMGQNDGNKKYNLLEEHILKDAQKLQWWLDQNQGKPPGGKSGAKRPPKDDPRSHRPPEAKEIVMR